MSKEICFMCEGTGKESEEDRHPLFVGQVLDCAMCEGTGKIPKYDPDYVYKGDWFE